MRSPCERMLLYDFVSAELLRKAFSHEARMLLISVYMGIVNVTDSVWYDSDCYFLLQKNIS